MATTSKTVFDLITNVLSDDWVAIQNWFLQNVWSNLTDSAKQTLLAKIEATNSVEDHVSLILDEKIIYNPVQRQVAILFKMFCDLDQPQKRLEEHTDSLVDATHSYEQHSYSDALAKINQAIIKLPMNLEDSVYRLNIARLIRAKILYRLQMLDQCIDEIEEVTNNRLAVNVLPLISLVKLLRLKSKSFQKLEMDIDPVVKQADSLFQRYSLNTIERKRFIDKISTTRQRSSVPSRLVAIRHVPSFPQNPYIPAVSGSIRLSCHERKGRIMIANEDIVEGALIANEPIYVSWIHSESWPSICYNCTKHIKNRFHACRTCERVRFCSSDCERQCWLTFHQQECPYMPLLKLLGIGHMVIKVLLTNNVQNICQIYRDQVETNSAEWINKPIGSHSYEVFNSLYCNIFVYERMQRVRFTVEAIFTALILEKVCDMKFDSATLHDVVSIVLAHIVRVRLNNFSLVDDDMHEVVPYDVWTYSSPCKKFGVGIYLATSFFSHSCSRNTSRLFLNGNLIYYARDAIPVGSEITITYGPDVRVKSFQDRQSTLLNGLRFRCECEYCLAGEENIDYAYQCEHCNGPLIENADKTNHCMRCNRRNQDLSEFQADRRERIRLYENVTQLQRDGDYQESVIILNYLIRTARHAYYTSMPFKVYLKATAQCCRQLGDYSSAVQLMKEYLADESRVYGPNSLEIIEILFQILSVHCEDQGLKIKELCKQSSEQINEQSPEVRNLIVTITEQYENFINKAVKITSLNSFEFMPIVDQLYRHHGHLVYK